MSTPKLRFKEFSGDWESKKLGDVGENIIGLTYSPTDIVLDGTGILVLRSSNIKNGRLDKTDSVRVKMTLKNKLIIKPNDILICTRNGSQRLIGKSVIISDKEKMTFGAFMSVYRSNYNKYIAYLLQTTWFFEQVQMNLGARINQITTGTLNNFTFSFPTLPEQNKIATFLTAVDEKINQLSQKQELLSQYKKGMMQKLFSQQIRFKADDGSEFGEWKIVSLRNFIEESKDKSKYQDEYEVFTSSRKGLVKQKDYFEGSRLIDRKNIGFNVIKPNEITYRSRSDDGLFFFNLNVLNTIGIISTYYPVFTMRNGDNRFFIEILNFYKCEYIKYAVGTSQLVLSLNELRKVKFQIPTLPEQTKIANFLSAIDQKIDLTTQQLEQAKQWKKGLLQQMFV